MSAEEFYIETPRSSLHAETEGQGRTIVLTHGLYLSGSIFERLQQRLINGGYRVINWDLAGHGTSKRKVEQVSVQGHAQDLIAIADHFELECYYAVGHSYGGRTVQHASQMDARILGMGLISTWHGSMPDAYKGTLETRLKWGTRVRPLVKVIPRFLMPIVLEETARSPNLADGLDFSACLDDPGVVLKRSLPTRLIHGRGDYTIAFELAEENAERWQGELTILETNSHHPYLTHVDETAKMIIDLATSE